MDKNRRNFLKKISTSVGIGLFSLPFVNALQNINFSNGTSQSSAGRTLQVKSATKTDTWSTTSTSWGTVTGLSVNITPSSVNSKILIMANVNLSMNGVTNYGFIRITRDGTAIGVGNASSSRTQAGAGGGVPNSSITRTDSINFLDSPSTTSEITYAIQARVQTGDTTWINRSHNDADNASSIRAASTIIVMEILGD